jgi:CRP-like cAMP-binding protein
VDTNTITELTKGFESTCVKKHQTIYRNGHSAHGFFYVKQGLIGLFQVSEIGRETLLRIYAGGSFFGYRSLFTEQTYPSTARAMLNSEIVHIDIKDFASLNLIAPEVACQLTKEVCGELGEAEKRLMQFNAYCARKRILDTVHYIFRTYPDYPWTYREIGEYSGTDTSTVIRYCKTLKEIGILNKNSRKPQPVDLNRLVRYRKTLVTS